MPAGVCVKCDKSMRTIPVEKAPHLGEFYCENCNISLPFSPKAAGRMDIINDLEKQGYGDKLREFYADIKAVG